MMAIFGEASTYSIVGFILVAISFVLQIVGFATPYWNYVATDLGKNYYGLWQYCHSNDVSSICVEIPCDVVACSSSLKGAQAMETLGFIVLLAAVVCIAIKIFVMKDKPIVYMAGIVCCFVGGVFSLVGAIVYATQQEIEAKNLHFSFAFSIIASIGGCVSGVLLIIGK